MYKLYIMIEDPLNSASRNMVVQFDPATLDEKKWADGFPTVRAWIDDLQASAAIPTRFTPLSL